MEFREELSKGRVLVKKTYRKNNTLFVQFIQSVHKGDKISSMQGFGYTTVTTNISVDGLDLKENYDYQANDEIVYADTLFDAEVNIMVLENTVPNNINHKPRTSLKSREPLRYKGEPVYRHTRLVQGEVQNVFLTYDFAFDVENKE